MSGLGIVGWMPGEDARYEKELAKAGYYIEHCSHCDRSNRHPSCVIVPIPGVVHGPIPKPPRNFLKLAEEA